jgi:hypothetical protein
MKLINAGLSGANTVYTQHLFNCTRNPKCERPFYVPISAWSDLMVYVDLPGKPETIEGVAEVLNICEEVLGGDFNDDFNDDFDIGNSVSSNTIVFNRYIVGQKPDGSWYGVFGNPMVTGGEGIRCFFLTLRFIIGGLEYTYFSEQICFENSCKELKRLESCYPNEPAGAEAEDPNGIYYGYPNNVDILGDETYRYLHWGYVRDASVTEQNNRLNFTAFNSKKTYKGTVDREHLLEFELVPTFYKNHILGIIARGDITIDDTAWRLATDQEIRIIDTDSKLWRMDILLAEQHKQTFGCGGECTLQGCEVGPTDADYSFDLSEARYRIEFEGASLSAGQQVEYELRNRETDEVVNAGVITAPDPLEFRSDLGIVDISSTCHILKWRTNCGTEEEPDWSTYMTKEIGMCATYPLTVEMASKDLDLTEEILVQYSKDGGATWLDLGSLIPNQELQVVGTVQIPDNTEAKIGLLFADC